MPTLYHRIEGSGVNILDTVADQVITGLLDELDLVRFFENAVYIIKSFTANSQFDDGNGAPSLNKNRCDVTVNYILDKSQVPWPVDTPYNTTAYGLRADKKGIHTPILMDFDSNILMEYYTVPCGIEFTFNMNFQTFDDACRTFDTIQTKYKGSLIQTPFDISFSFPVTQSMYQYLNEVYKAKTDYASKTILDYINDKKVSEISFDVRKSQIIEENADKALMIRCLQLSNQAQLTMEQKEPEVVRAGQLSDSFTIEFTLAFQFGRPDLVAVHTPIVVDNTPLPYALFENLIINAHYNPYVAGVTQDLMISEYTQRSYGNYNRSAQLIRLPVYDDWYYSDKMYVFYEYRPILISAFTLDGPVTTIDLKQIDNVVLHPIVQDIIRQTGNKIFNYGGLFHIGVFANNLRLDNTIVSIDDNLIMTIHSNRPDQSYHFMISETTNIAKTDPSWDPLLIKYRYFFPMTIERNLQVMIDKRYLYIDYDDDLLNFINRLGDQGRLKTILDALVYLEEDTNQIYSYTQNAAQLADYLVYTKSSRENYTIPLMDPEDPTSNPIPILVQYYGTVASVEGRSLYVAFMEQCLIRDYISINDIPSEYIRTNRVIFPYTKASGGFYGFNTPIRVFQYNIRTQ